MSSAGDVNGDGFDDLIISAPRANPNGDYAGASYVVFGAAGIGPGFDLASLNGTNGFRLDGDYSSYRGSLSGAGDVNGDGFDDVIVGALSGTAPGYDASYVVFGAAGGFAASLDLAALDGSDGFRIDGIDPNDGLGFSVSGAGDFNGDGFADVVLGANYAYDPGAYGVGESYVVFGKASGFAPTFDLATLDGTNGFRLAGFDTNGQSGRSVSGAGDVNGDGLDDVIIAAPFAANSNFAFGAGRELRRVRICRCAWPKPRFGRRVDGNNGFRLEGIDQSDNAGFSVSGAGDVNGDGFGRLDHRRLSSRPRRRSACRRDLCGCSARRGELRRSSIFQRSTAATASASMESRSTMLPALR